MNMENLLLNSRNLNQKSSHENSLQPRAEFWFRKGIAMADTRCQVECEDWVRREWMPTVFGKSFYRERMPLTSGGVFDFDAVSADKTMIASISTSGARTASGKHAVGKLMKLRSDILFLLMSKASRKLIILCEPDMYALCQRELDGGRVPKEIEFFHAPLPDELAIKLAAAGKIGSDEVSPVKAIG